MITGRIFAATFVAFFLISTTNCSGKKPGEFAFFLADQSELTLVEKINYTARRFNRFKQPASFDEDKILWIYYKPQGMFAGGEYLLSLYRRSLGWIEIESRMLKFDPRRGGIIDYYNDLTPGKYLIKVAKDNEVIDTYRFDIFETGGNEIDYEADLREAPGDIEEFDDIRHYSQ